VIDARRDTWLPPGARERGIDRAEVIDVPMTTRFRRVTARQSLLLHGPAGWGECAPFWDYGPQESAAWYASALKAATTPTPPALRTMIPVNVTVPAVDPEQAAAIASRGGCASAKVKVAEPGQQLTDDVARVVAVREALGPAAAIRVDANGAWDVDTAVSAIAAIDRAAGGLEYVEQPCAAVDDLAAVRRRVSVPIAADESVRRAEDPLAVARAGAADILIVKVAPLGGIRRALEIVAEAGLPAVVSSALETSIGIATGLALAAALPELDHGCGLATVALLCSDVVVSPLLPVGGMLPAGPVTVDEQALARVRADDDTWLRWRDRIEQIVAVR
jgi:o-succinylbenzoate synthase